MMKIRYWGIALLKNYRNNITKSMKPFILEDHQYSYEKKGKRTFYSIGNNTNPATLSKYYGLSSYSVDALEKSHIYLPQAEDFNDIFDASPFLWNFNNLQLSQFKNYLTKWWRITHDELQKKYKEDSNLLIEEFRYYLHQHTFSKFGLICMTEDKYSDAMRGYYGNNEGFLIEFNHSLFAKDYCQGPFPINYLKRKKPISPSEFDNDWMLAYLIQLFTKKDIWAHEKEYRYIVETPDYFQMKGRYNNENIQEEKLPRLFSYSSESVLEVYLGVNFVINEQKKRLSKDTYSIELQSCQRDMKRGILEICMEKNYKMFQMIPNLLELSLIEKPIIVTHDSRYKFQIKYI